MQRTSTEPIEYNEIPSLDDRVGHLLRRAYQKASGNLARQLRGSGLTVPRFAVLYRLREIGAVSQNRLGRLVAMEPANILDIVRALKKQDVVATRQDPGDARRRLVELTPKGVDLIDDLIAVSEEATRQTLSPLSEVEQQTLKSLLARIADGPGDQ